LSGGIGGEAFLSPSVFIGPRVDDGVSGGEIASLPLTSRSSELPQYDNLLGDDDIPPLLPDSSPSPHRVGKKRDRHSSELSSPGNGVAPSPLLRLAVSADLELM